MLYSKQTYNAINLTSNDIKGEGFFSFYVNDKRIKSVSFGKADSNFTMADLDFSEDLYKEFKNLYPSSCAAGKVLKMKLVIEGYDSDGIADRSYAGFRFSYIFALNFKSSVMKSSANPPILFSLNHDITDEALFDSTTTSSQVNTIRVTNISGKAQGMIVAIISIPSCL